MARLGVSEQEDSFLTDRAPIVSEREEPERDADTVGPVLNRRWTSRPLLAHAAIFEALLSILDRQYDHKIGKSTTNM
jgi:hypothetical protein